MMKQETRERETTERFELTREEIFADEKLENSSSRLQRRPSRLFDALTASPHLSRVWQAAASVCLLAALWSWWSGRVDAAFILAACGGVAWFMNLRGHFYRATKETDLRRASDAE